ncbi:DNA-binding response regulator [Streptomyces palmae]|uniref:DNA-binding response regulator n=1 Tax=Streptomyces palmae TaxID=1701085 RepID=A0A4Z0GCL8_9ACTN|nr:DNA-binding response regulator [Streptomyces palmae]TGA92536.1 DNA-binding response regulator [Streptomyces palmae]
MNERAPLGSAGPDVPDDTIERTLRQVRTLIESTVAEHRARQDRDRQVAEVGVAMADAEIRAAAAQVARSARQTVDVVLPDQGTGTAPLHNALAELAAGIGEPVSVRLLCGRPPECWTGRAEVRTSQVPLPTLVMADRGSALVCAESAAGRQTSMVRDPEVVRTLHSLFVSVWGGATRLGGPFEFDNRARADMVRRVLERLRDGVTDEAAARDLAVSVRTYRRYVTAILELLGASSRFQAGVRATELGILRDR